MDQSSNFLSLVKTRLFLSAMIQDYVGLPMCRTTINSINCENERILKDQNISLENIKIVIYGNNGIITGHLELKTYFKLKRDLYVRICSL